MEMLMKTIVSVGEFMLVLLVAVSAFGNVIKLMDVQICKYKYADR